MQRGLTTILLLGSLVGWFAWANLSRALLKNKTGACDAAEAKIRVITALVSGLKRGPKSKTETAKSGHHARSLANICRVPETPPEMAQAPVCYLS
jgi:hypothetical protein